MRPSKEKATSSALVVLVRHSLVNGSVDDNISVVSEFQSVQVVAHAGSSMLSEGLGEFISRSCSVASHFINYDLF